jgi:hypothetical protein
MIFLYTFAQIYLMKNFIIFISFIGLSVFLISWGIYGHERINKSAVLALPQPLLSFFYNHIDYVTQESTVPDLRKYTMNDKTENPRHYIDLENYGGKDSMPETMADAKAKYDEKFLQINGILPWYMEDMMDKLTKSFKEKRKTEILFLASDLGHYMGDAHMPLHTSANHDGQMTGQKGIHALWESQLPEINGKDYNYYSGEPKHIEDVHKEIRRIIFASFKLKDTLLSIDAEIRKRFTEEKMYKHDVEGKVLKNKFGSWIYSDDYTSQLHTALHGMVERQLRTSIADLSNFLYTAWVNAGKPDLSALDSSDLTSRNRKHLDEDLKLFKQGKLFGLTSENDF